MDSTAAGGSFSLRSPSLNSIRLRRIFDIFDKNGDCTITVDELAQALALLGLQADFSQVESMVQAHIQPGCHGLRFQDFEALHRSLNDAFFSINEPNNDGDDEKQLQQQRDESDLSEAFKVFDEDGDGYISARELHAVLSKLGLLEGGDVEMDQIQMMISSVDQDCDGRVDFREFKHMMSNVVIVPAAASSRSLNFNLNQQ